MRPQEVAWTEPLDEDELHTRYVPDQVAAYFAAATQAALVLAAFRAPYRGRSTPVDAWWGSFDLATNLFSGLPADPPSHDFIMRNAMDAQEVAVGWWPGDARYGRRRSTPTPTPRPTASVGVPLTGRGALGQDPRGIHPRLGRRRRLPGPARLCGDVRPLGLSARLRRLLVGPEPGGERTGVAAARRLDRRTPEPQGSRLRGRGDRRAGVRRRPRHERHGGRGRPRGGPLAGARAS